MLYVVQVRRKGKRKWRTVTKPWPDWSALNAWLGENWWVWPLFRWERRIRNVEESN